MIESMALKVLKEPPLIDLLQRPFIPENANERLAAQLSKYGLSTNDYHRMRLGQRDRCAICGRVSDKRRLSVDHDHASGEVRALLCGNCNAGLGMFKDSPELLRSAAEYIESFRKAKPLDDVA